MKRKPIIITLALLLIAGSAFAQMPGKGYGMNYQENRQEQNRLLNDEERDKVAEAKRDFEKSAIPLRADIKVLKMELGELITEGKSNKEITGKFDALNDAEEKLAKARLDHQIEIRKIVGEDKYKSMCRHFMYTRHEGRGGRKGGGRNQQIGGKKPNAYGEGGRQYYKQPVCK